MFKNFIYEYLPIDELLNDTHMESPNFLFLFWKKCKCYYTESNLETQSLVNKSPLISYRLKRFDTFGIVN